MNTADFVERLANAARPVRVVRPPLVRTGCWLLIALAAVIPLAASHGLRPDLLQQLRNPTFVVGVGASFLTGALAAYACLTASLPDRSRGWLLLPLPPLAAWLATLGHGCWADWVSYETGGLRFGGAVRCLATALLVSLPLSITMFAMLRHVVRLRPGPVILAAGLAVAALTSTAMSLLYRLDTTVVNLALNLGLTVAVVVVEAVVARRLLTRVTVSTGLGRE